MLLILSSHWYLSKKKRKRNKKKNKGRGDSLDTTVDESLDSPQESLSSVESQPCSLAVNDPVVPSKDKQVALSENNAVTVDTKGSVEGPDESTAPGVSAGPKSTQDQTSPMPTSETVTQENDKSTALTNSSKKSNTINNKEQKNDNNSKNKEDRGDQNNMEPEARPTRQSKQKGKKEQKETPATQQNLSQVIPS